MNAAPLGTPRILVIGDVMVDVTIDGTVERFSPEAAVPVFKAPEDVTCTIGGAGAVARMAAALGADVTLAGVLGRDGQWATNRQIRGALQSAGVDDLLLWTDDTRWTTKKLRFRDPRGPVLRVDYERTDEWTPPEEWTKGLLAVLPHYDIVLVADYGKGALSAKTLADVFGAHNHVIVDPARGRDWCDYRGCWGFKPNRDECRSRQDQLRTNSCGPFHSVSWMLFTQGADGMVLSDGRPYPKRETHFRATPRIVRDVCGAGDQVLATLGVCLGSGMDLVTACRWANVAGGMQVERDGIVPIRRQWLIREVLGKHIGKHVSVSDAVGIALVERTMGHKVVFTNGCFDLLHAGHVAMLQEAKQQGDCLIVAVNSDASVRAVKGDGRPLRPLNERLALLAGLECVDLACVLEEQDPTRLIGLVSPDVLVKGGDYLGEHAVVGREALPAGGRVHLTKFVRGVSTRAIFEDGRRKYELQAVELTAVHDQNGASRHVQEQE